MSLSYLFPLFFLEKECPETTLYGELIIPYAVRFDGITPDALFQKHNNL